MSKDPGEWYREQDLKASKLSAEVKELEQAIKDQQIELAHLQKKLERVRYVGD